MQFMTRTLSSTVLAVAALTGVVGAQAQTSSGMGMGGYSFYSPGNGYIGLNVGKSDYSLARGAGGFNSDNRDNAYNLSLGSFFSPNLGFEIGYTDFGKVSRAGGQTDAEGVNFSLVGRAPLGSQFNLLGKLGTTYGRTHTSASILSGIPTGSESGFGLSYGVGAEYTFTPQWSAVLAYDEHKLKFAGGSKERISATTVGLRYRF